MPAAVERIYEVRTPSIAIEVSHVADLVVGAQGELILRDRDGGDVAIFAPGQWLAAFATDDPPEAD